MIVLIDGVEVKCNNDIKIIYENEAINEDDGSPAGDVHLTITNEGLITDIFEKGEVTMTSSTPLEDLIECCQ